MKSSACLLIFSVGRSDSIKMKILSDTYLTTTYNIFEKKSEISNFHDHRNYSEIYTQASVNPHNYVH